MPVGYEDGTIDWVDFYRGHGVGRIKRSGSKHMGLCPLHDNTRTPAFWFTTDNGMWKCEAGCGQGNPTTFLSRRLDISTKEADRMLCELAGVTRHAEPRKKAAPVAPYDVAAYAAEKGLDEALLASWGLSSSRGAVLIPYAPGEPGGAVRRRMRPDAEKRFSWVTSGGRMQGALGLYGLFRGLGDAAVVLVEGESDCHALWSLGIAAYGVPGASTFRGEWLPPHVKEVLVHDEGDDGARVFVERVARELAGKVAVRRFSTPGDAKDPSELYAKDPAGAEEALREAMRGALAADAAAGGTDTRPGDVLAPLGLVCPAGWVVGAGGIRRFNEETQQSRLVTTTPVVLSARIVDAATGRERVRLSFMRGGRWHEVTADREDAFSSRSIVGVLAPLGAQVTSENARDVVRWLGALEQANMDAVEVVKSARELGWCNKSFMPTNPRGLTLDMQPGSEDVVAAFAAKGEMADWTAAMGRESARSPVFRFILAAGLAPCLLKATGGRIFFVYNWGPSRGGKTAAIKAALSCWGDPEVLLVTFNATSVGLERRAALMRDLPLGIDERQAASGDQRRLDEVVYALSSGTGRVRGARDGGLQAQSHWRTVAVATGEEPLSGATSKTGVATRVLEIFGSPFTSEEAAAGMHRLTGECHGHAGPAFIERLVEAGDGAVRDVYGAVRESLTESGKSHALSHLDGIATVLAADVLLSRWFYGVSEADALFSAAALGREIMGKVEVAASGDVDEQACLWVEDWLRSRVGQFSDNGFHGPLLGEKRGTTWLVYPSPFREAIENSGFSYRKTMKALEERGALKTDGNGRNLTSSQRVYGEQKRVLWIEETALGGVSDPTLDLEGAKGAPF
jgi:hypothetical protein